MSRDREDTCGGGEPAVHIFRATQEVKKYIVNFNYKSIITGQSYAETPFDFDYIKHCVLNACAKRRTCIHFVLILEDALKS